MNTVVEKLQKQLEDAKRKQLEIELAIAEAKRRGTREQAAIIDALPKRLGVANLEAVASLIRSRIRGEFGPLEAGQEPAGTGRGHKLMPEMKTKLLSLLTEVLAPGYSGELTGEKIAEMVGCSHGTVGNYRAALKKQLAAQAPTPAVA